MQGHCVDGALVAAEHSDGPWWRRRGGGGGTMPLRCSPLFHFLCCLFPDENERRKMKEWMGCALVLATVTHPQPVHSCLELAYAKLPQTQSCSSRRLSATKESMIAEEVDVLQGLRNEPDLPVNGLTRRLSLYEERKKSIQVSLNTAKGQGIQGACCMA